MIVPAVGEIIPVNRHNCLHKVRALFVMHVRIIRIASIVCYILWTPLS